MPDLEYTTVRIDTETLEKVRQMATANLRSVPMQLRALILGSENTPVPAAPDGQLELPNLPAPKNPGIRY